MKSDLFSRCSIVILTLLVMSLLVCPNSGSATEISLNVQITAKDEDFSTIVRNQGKDPISGIYIDTDVVGRHYAICVKDDLKAGEKFQLRYNVPGQPISGTYPTVTHVSYLIENHRLGVVEVSPIYYHMESPLAVSCSIPPVTFRNQTRLSIVKPTKYNGVTTKFIPPNHIHSAIMGENPTDAYVLMYVDETSLRSQGSAFAVFETNENGVHSTAICPIKMTTQPSVQASSWYSSGFLLFTALLSIGAAFYWFVRNPNPSSELVARIRWAFSVSACSLIYLGYRHLGMIPDQFGPFINWYEQIHLLHPKVGTSLRTLLERLYFIGGDYEIFFRQVADPLYSYMLVANYFFLRYVARPSPEDDKYWHLMVSWFRSIFFRRFIRIVAGSNGRKVRDFGYSRELKKVAVLSYLVKLFFLPMLWSWALGNVNQIQNLLYSPPHEFLAITKALITAMIFIDVSIFAIGYTVEVPRLRNVIKSVEPTFLGWFVCLICYPPFNTVFFSPFDRNYFDTWPAWSDGTRQLVTVLVVLMWFVYTWASVALAMKASNLTNRGIVAHGPYRFVRHPAYTGKVSVWVLSALFLGEGYGMNVTAALCVYILRALTEERHLSRDPEYIEYRKKVRWMFIPGLI